MNDGKKNLIIDYITEDECNYMCDDALYNCDSCSNLEDCYMYSCDRCNKDFIKNTNYGGYTTEEEYWEQIFD